MKRIIVGALILALAAASFAQGQDTARVGALIDGGVAKNYEAIRAASGEIDLGQRQRLYESKKNQPWIPMAVNFAVGLGIGSFIQKDPVGGFISLGGDMLSLGAVLGGILLSTSPGSLGQAAGYAIWGGLAFFSAVRIFEVAWPLVYATTYNGRLRSALDLANP
jgi:hypothetical protein